MGLLAFYELPTTLNTNIILFAFFVSIFIYMSGFTFKTFHRFRFLVNCFCKFLFELIIPCFSNALCLIATTPALVRLPYSASLQGHEVQLTNYPLPITFKCINYCINYSSNAVIQ